MRPKRKHGRILNVCMWLYILYVRERICSALSDKPPCCGTGCCLTNGSPLTSSLGVSSEIHHVTSWSTCSADILPEMPFRFDSSGLDTIVCLLHNLSAGKMWSNFFFFFLFFFSPCCFQLGAHTWGCLSPGINVSVADFTVNYGEGIQTAMDLHAFFWTGPCANGG